MDTYNVELEVFEGPLDLLLHLVRKHELDILDIPIAFVTAKYLEYLDLMKSMNLDIAGEYLLMAATLAHIKSRELLPTPEVEDPDDADAADDGEDPRQELIRRLLEYQKYRDVAEHLGERPVMGRNVWPRGVSREEAIADNVDTDADAPLAEVPIARLIAALDRVLKSAKVSITHDVTVDRLRVSDRMNEIIDRFERESEFSFSSCFDFLGRGEPHGAAQLKHEVVVTFLAILEMAKLGMLRLSQTEGEDEILLCPGEGDLRARADAADVSPDSEYQ